MTLMENAVALVLGAGSHRHKPVRSAGVRGVSASRARVLVTALLSVLPFTASGAVFCFVDVGNHMLEPGLANQLVQLSLVVGATSDPVTVRGLDLVLEVTPGGPDDPVIQAVNTLTGTLFGGFAATQAGDSGNTDWFQFWSTTVSTDPFPTVAAGGTVGLVNLLFDTTTAHPGTYDLNLFVTTADSTTLYDQSGTAISGFQVYNGTLTVVPEPAVGWGAVLGLGVVFVRLTRRFVPGAR